MELTNRTAVMSDAVNNLIPTTSRIIRLKYDYYNNEVVSNDWGYAFIIKDYIGVEAFDIYLGSVSFYSNENSKFFKMEYVTSNIDCFSLNLQYSSESDSGD